METTEIPEKLQTELHDFLSMLLNEGLMQDKKCLFKLSSHQYRHSDKNPKFSGKIIFTFSQDEQDE